MKVSFKPLLMASFMGLILMGSGALHSQIKLRYAHVGVAHTPQTLCAEEVAKLVKQRLNSTIYGDKVKTSNLIATHITDEAH